LVIFDVPFSICSNSTTNPAIDAGIIALEISCSGFLHDILHVSILVTKQKLLGFKQVVSRLGLDWQSSMYLCLIRRNSTTNPAMDAKSIELKRSETLLPNEVLDFVVLLLQRKL
jgi:hypothetical protein